MTTEQEQALARVNEVAVACAQMQVELDCLRSELEEMFSRVEVCASCGDPNRVEQE